MFEFIENENDFLDEVTGQNGIGFTDEQRKRIHEKLTGVVNYCPKIIVLGKTGVSKSSLINAIFGSEVCRVNPVEACTREPQSVLVDMGVSQSLCWVDMPGVSESSQHDKQYTELYKKVLPDADVILWLLKADDRAYASDEMFFDRVIKPHTANTPFFFVLTQCDKIDPLRDWDYAAHMPGAEQLANIRRKIFSVAQYFGIDPSKVIPVSAHEQYNIAGLIDEIVSALPRDKKISFYAKIPVENRTYDSASVVRKAWYECVCDAIVAVCGNVKDIVFHVLDKSGSAIERFFQKIFNL